jgi:hypothetical protein
VSIEANKLMMQRFAEFINTASAKLATELVSPNAVFYVPDAPNRCGDRLVTSRLSG